MNIGRVEIRQLTMEERSRIPTWWWPLVGTLTIAVAIFSLVAFDNGSWERPAIAVPFGLVMAYLLLRLTQVPEGE